MWIILDIAAFIIQNDKVWCQSRYSPNKTNNRDELYYKTIQTNFNMVADFAWYILLSEQFCVNSQILIFIRQNSNLIFMIHFFLQVCLLFFLAKQSLFFSSFSLLYIAGILPLFFSHNVGLFQFVHKLDCFTKELLKFDYKI